MTCCVGGRSLPVGAFGRQLVPHAAIQPTDRRVRGCADGASLAVQQPAHAGLRDAELTGEACWGMPERYQCLEPTARSGGAASICACCFRRDGKQAARLARADALRWRLLARLAAIDQIVHGHRANPGGVGDRAIAGAAEAELEDMGSHGLGVYPRVPSPVGDLPRPPSRVIPMRVMPLRGGRTTGGPARTAADRPPRSPARNWQVRLTRPGSHAWRTLTAAGCAALPARQHDDARLRPRARSDGTRGCHKI